MGEGNPPRQLYERFSFLSLCDWPRFSVTEKTEAKTLQSKPYSHAGAAASAANWPSINLFLVCTYLPGN